MELRLNKLHEIDVVDFLDAVSKECVDLIVADPPFNKGKDYGKDYDDKLGLEEYYQFCQRWIELGFQTLKSTGSFWVYTNSQHLGRLQTIMNCYGCWQNTIVWRYTNPTPDKKRFPKGWSGWLFFSKSNDFYFNPFFEAVKPFTKDKKSTVELTRLDDVWNDISKLTGGYLAQREVILIGDKRVFVYQLPEKMIARIVGCCSQEGDLILDLFSHSATTSVVSVRMRRNFMAVEQSPYFVQMSNRRLQKEKERIKGFFKV